MNINKSISLLMLGAIGASALGLNLEPLQFGADPPTSSQSQKVIEAERGSPPPSINEARQLAELLHEAMHSTLQVVHHKFYRENESLPLPAAVMKDVFEDIEKEKHVSLRWLAVDGQAMNTDHNPQTKFEVEAYKALKSGKKSYEAVEEGVYMRAGAIRLGNNCLKCHVPDRKSLENRTAGLIISMRVHE